MRKVIEALGTGALTIFLLNCTPTIAVTEIYVHGPHNGPPDCGNWLSYQNGSVEREWNKSWLMGLLSGYALGTNKNFLAGISPISTFFWMDKYCRENPLNGATEGAITLINELQKQKGMK